MLLLTDKDLDRARVRSRIDEGDWSGSSARQQLLTRAQALDPGELLLVQLGIINRVPCRQIAEALKVPAGTVSRRLRRLLNRLCDPISVALLDERCPLPSDLRELGIERFVQNRAVPKIARDRRVRPEQVHRSIAYIRGWFRGVNSPRPRHPD